MRGRFALPVSSPRERGRALISYVKESRAARQSSLLIVSQGLTAILSFGLTVLITRGLSVDDYGAFRYAMTFLALAMTVLQFGWPYSTARLLAVEHDDARQRELVGACALMMGTSAVIGLVVTVAAVFALKAVGARPVAILLWVAPFIYVTLGQTMITSVCQGLNRIAVLSAQQVLPYVILIPVTAIQIYLLREYSLAAAFIGYVATFTLVIGIGLGRLGARFTDVTQQLRALRTENRRTGLPIYIGGLFGVASAQIVTLWVAQHTTSDGYGQYALAVAITSPAQVVLSSLGSVIFRSSAGRRSLNTRVLGYSFALGIVISLSFVVAAELLLVPAFGSAYAPSVGMAQVLVLGTVCIGWGDILQRFLGAQGHGRRLGSAAIATGIVGISSAAFLLPHFGVRGAIASSLAASVTYLLAMLWLYRHHAASAPSAGAWAPANSSPHAERPASDSDARGLKDADR